MKKKLDFVDWMFIGIAALVAISYIAATVYSLFIYKFNPHS